MNLPARYFPNGINGIQFLNVSTVCYKRNFLTLMCQEVAINYIGEFR